MLVASTQQRQPLVQAKTNKPEAILYYNATRGGIDVRNAVIETTICPAPTKR